MSVIGGSGSSYGHIEDAELARRVAALRERNLAEDEHIRSMIATDENAFPSNLMIHFIAEATKRGFSGRDMLWHFVNTLTDETTTGNDL